MDTRDQYFDALTEAMISIEYERYCPTMSLNVTAYEIQARKESALNPWRTDAVFHARVTSIVRYLASLADKHCNYKETP